MTMMTPEIHAESCVDFLQALGRYMMYRRIGVENVISQPEESAGE